jgi:HEPN domain-containing protein
MVIKEEYRALFDLGCEDLKLVEKNLKDKEIREQILLFHLQQAVEKFLKSLISLNHVRFPKIHDIEELIELCKENKIPLPEFVDEFVSLTPFAVEFRYGIIIEETLDINYFYQKVKEFKKFTEKSITEHNKG